MPFALETCSNILQAVREVQPEATVLYVPPPTAADANPALPPYKAPKEGEKPVNPIAQLSAGTRHNLVVSRSGHVYSWGLGSSCQLGLGSDIDHVQVPTRVRSKALDDGWKVEYASSGGQHCALLVTKPAAAA